MASRAFAVWVTGLPASGKSTIVAALKEQLAARGIDVAVLESDVLRSVFGSEHGYDEAGREAFYRALVWVGKLLVEHGVSVIFDATANRRAYRELARQSIARFIEVYVDTPLEVCMARDPKGIYRAGVEGRAGFVPGLQAEYEAPEGPEVLVSGDGESAEASAAKIIVRGIEGKEYLSH